MDCTMARFFLGKMSLKLGESIPENAKHAVSVSLPLWSDNVAYEEGDVRVTKLLKGGYPRFVFHSYVEKLFKYFERRFTRSLDEACMVLCSRSAAQDCRDYIKKIEKDASVRLVEQTLSTSHHPAPISSTDPYVTLNANPITLYIIVLPRNLFKLAKSFWQHSGEIISSRYAEYCLRIVDGNVLSSQFGPETKRYSSSELYKLENQHSTSTEIFTKAQESESNIFVEERYARNMDYRMGELAKVSLRKRIAGVLGDHIEISRKGLTEDDVYLYPTGMSAIYNCHRIIQKIYPKLHTVQFGFCYLDTLKIQQKFGSCHFLGNGDDNDMKKLENDILPTQKISALFCEFPSNPLLKSVDLKKLASLADKYGFILVIDETIGNFLNVSVVEWADVVVSSLTKIFSGDSNVMGGAMILNPKSEHYATLKKELSGSYIDCIWLEDAIFLERNSRSFKERNIRINGTAELLVDYLKGLEVDSIVEIFYPKYTTSEAYLQCKTDSGGFGGLFSIGFRTEEQSSRCYDALDIRKGPSLGTNFTLACPYTILAHYHELSWAAEFGVSKFLVRVSVGLEDFEDLKNAFRRATENI